MLSFLFERHHRVLMSRFAGSVGSDDLAVQVRLARAFVEREGPVRTIVDFTGVTEVRIDARTIAAMAARAESHTRIFVVPQPEMFGLARLYSTHSNLAGGSTPSLVRSVAEACAVFSVQEADFEPVALE